MGAPPARPVRRSPFPAGWSDWVRSSQVMVQGFRTSRLDVRLVTVILVPDSTLCSMAGRSRHGVVAERCDALRVLQGTDVHRVVQPIGEMSSSNGTGWVLDADALLTQFGPQAIPKTKPPSWMSRACLSSMLPPFPSFQDPRGELQQRALHQLSSEDNPTLSVQADLPESSRPCRRIDDRSTALRLSPAGFTPSPHGEPSPQFLSASNDTGDPASTLSVALRDAWNRRHWSAFRTFGLRRRHLHPVRCVPKAVPGRLETSIALSRARFQCDSVGDGMDPASCRNCRRDCFLAGFPARRLGGLEQGGKLGNWAPASQLLGAFPISGWPCS